MPSLSSTTWTMHTFERVESAYISGLMCLPAVGANEVVQMVSQSTSTQQAPTTRAVQHEERFDPDGQRPS